MPQLSEPTRSTDKSDSLSDNEDLLAYGSYFDVKKHKQKLLLQNS